MSNSAQEAVYTKANHLLNAGKYREAISALKTLAETEKYKVNAFALIGICLYHLNSYRSARVYLEKALAVQPDITAAIFYLAKTLAALGDYAEAARQYGLATREDPKYNDAWQGEFDSLLIQGKLDACEAVLNRWKVSSPQSEKHLIAAAILLRAKGKNIDAIRAAQSGLVEEPDNAKLHAFISEILLELKRLQEALAFINRAIEINSSDIGFYCIKANVHYLMSQVSECAAAYAQAFSLCPSSATLYMNQHCLFPIIASSSEEIDRCRAHFIEYLALAENNQQLELALEHPMSLHTFHLAYHNKDDRKLLERYLQFMKRLAEPLISQLANSRKHLKSTASKTTAEKKIRIGFLSRYFYEHSNAFAFEGLIQHLDRDKFFVILIHSAGSQNDNTQERLDLRCDKVVRLSGEFSIVYHELHDLSLDILYFTDLGMTPYDFLLPFVRACKIQLTGWGIPHTSGHSEIDFYISARDLEPENAQEQYTEELVMLPGGLSCCFIPNDYEVPSLPREYFFLPSHCRLIGCLQALHKLHPDFDLVMEEIAIHNPDSIFVFIEASISQTTELFIKRLSSNAPNVRGQSLFLKIMGRREYQALCKCMDILLDPIYYGCGITFYEAVLAGTPIVTLEGGHLRSRIVASGYREMGIYNAPVATSLNEYIQIVDSLLENDEKRHSLQKQIMYQRHRVMNRADYVRNFEDFCLDVMGHNQYYCH
ncbi:tetratricopeptide repeat protein [Synechococcus sp. CCY 9618]|uniref:tetratricopeptide repeat protein n=1 Tax=Synechococcus sp. CCY 9618 TaxID=2815602 RepID=UPI001C24A09F|nr:tetratricopeptide repeat protein [Synechococcus sp. CCY 9618]